jgi:hypothetical protein
VVAFGAGLFAHRRTVRTGWVGYYL